MGESGCHWRRPWRRCVMVRDARVMERNALALAISAAGRSRCQVVAFPNMPTRRCSRSFRDWREVHVFLAWWEVAVEYLRGCGLGLGARREWMKVDVTGEVSVERKERENGRQDNTLQAATGAQPEARDTISPKMHCESE